MNKKNITIDTDFFDDGIEAKLKAYHTDQVLTESGRKSSTIVEHYRQASYDNSIPNSRYEYVPDNQYSTGYDNYDMPPQTINKLQAANNFQNIISRAMANLFVRCWEQMKALLPQYSNLVQQVQQNQPKKINQQVLQDYNNVFNNDPSQVEENLKIQQTNVFSKKNEHLDERKNQIIERQRKGLTLDSLSKQKINRSKSIKKQIGKIKTQQIQKEQREVQSRKSYRQKFLQYKHRSKSRDLGLQKSLTYTKFSTNIPYERQANITSFDGTRQYSTINNVTKDIRNVHSTSNILHSKNQILRNIKDLLIDRQDIYQGQNYNYFINHRDSSRNMFSYQTNSYIQQPLNSFNKIQYNASTELGSYQNDEEEIVRTQLIQQIVDKLNFSKLRLEQIQKPKNEEQQILKRIDKLQKIILQLKQQEKVQYYRPQQHHQIIHHKIEQRATNQPQNLETYKKFVDQIASLRSEIKEIRNIKPLQPQKIFINDNSSNHIITQQQKLLSSYQQEFQKLMSEKQKATTITEREPQIIQTAKKSIFDQLIQNGKNSQKKVTWDQGWQRNQTDKKLYELNIVNQQNQINQQIIRKSRKIQHLDRDEGFQKYRYTRNQVLQNIGLKAQLQEQQRLWREQQARMQLDRERRDEQVRIMVENVRRQRNGQVNSQNIINQKNTREKYQKQWQMYNYINGDNKQTSAPYCSLFQC